MKWSFEEEDAFYKELNRFRGLPERYEHRTRLIDYTPGVRHLTARLNAEWLIDLIAIAQPVARRDEELRLFQLWEVFAREETTIVVVCSRCTDDPAFTKRIRGKELPINYTYLYVMERTLCLPRERLNGTSLSEERASRSSIA